MVKKENLEEKIKRTERLAFLGSLAGGLAHEIRNPLSTLKVNLELLKEDWEKADSIKEQKAYKKILILLQEVNRLEEVLNNFLKYAGNYVLNLQEHNLNNLLDEVLEFFMSDLIKQKIRLLKYYDDSLPLMMLDNNLIKQAFLNIIKNAYEAMPQGGELILKTSRPESEIAQVEIIDTGEGIPPEIIDKIFNAYFSTKKTGTGLGLAITKRIIEEHNGSIEVISELHKGSCFIVKLPINIK